MEIVYFFHIFLFNFELCMIDIYILYPLIEFRYTNLDATVFGNMIDYCTKRGGSTGGVIKHS